MKRISLVFFVCLSSAVYGGMPDLSNLGADIERSVKESLAPLDNLGARIHSQVQSNLAPLNNLGEQIESQVNSNLAPLNNLGTQINEQVQQGLLPVRAMVMRLQMINGDGGTTVVRYSDGKTLLIENGYHYECSGDISDRGQCQGTLSRLNMDQKDNYCYLSPTVRANNYLCLSEGNRGISLTNINGKVTCSTNDNTPVLVISLEDYDKMCANKGRNPTYTYIADVNNPTHVEIPNDNPLLKCQNNEPNICVFS